MPVDFDRNAHGVRLRLFVLGLILAAGLVDRVVAYVAPVLLGAGPAALGDAGIGTIASALRLQPDDVTVLGPDVRITARVVREEED